MSKKNYLIEQQTILNELRSTNMNLQELRFFTIYLARLNANDISTRVIHFTLEEFQTIMELERDNVNYLQKTTDNLLCKIIRVYYVTGGYKAFQLFKECHVGKDENGEWYVEFDTHDNALPLMFEFKEKYFRYKLWYALRLKSSNQLRMYEILKQYETLGKYPVSISALKELLGIKQSHYHRYDNFKIYVLNVCQEALEKYTDIKFTFEPSGRLGKGGKVHSIKFTVSHNKNYADDLSLDYFIDMQEVQTDETVDRIVNTVFKNERLSFLTEACNKEFTEAQIQVLHNLLIEIIPYAITNNQYDYSRELYDYLKRRYDELNMQAERKEITSRFGYLKKMIEADITASK